MIKYALIAVVIAAVLVGVTYCAPVPTVTVQTTENRPGYNPDNYKRPVREGNCWRQFTANDSILVCH